MWPVPLLAIPIGGQNILSDKLGVYGLYWYIKILLFINQLKNTQKYYIILLNDTLNVFNIHISKINQQFKPTTCMQDHPLLIYFQCHIFQKCRECLKKAELKETFQITTLLNVLNKNERNWEQTIRWRLTSGHNPNNMKIKILIIEFVVFCLEILTEYFLIQRIFIINFWIKWRIY